MTKRLSCFSLVAQGFVLVSLAAAAEVKPGGTWIEEAGGSVIRDTAGKIAGVDLRASWVTDTDLRKLSQLPDLNYLDLSLTRVTDQGMQEIKKLTGIVEL